MVWNKKIVINWWVLLLYIRTMWCIWLILPYILNYKWIGEFVLYCIRPNLTDLLLYYYKWNVFKWIVTSEIFTSELYSCAWLESNSLDPNPHRQISRIELARAWLSRMMNHGYCLLFIPLFNPLDVSFGIGILKCYHPVF